MRTSVKIGLVVVGAAAAIWILTFRFICPIEPAWHLVVAGDIRELTKALEAYKQARGNYPTTLQAAIAEQHWKRLPIDPWRHEYIYRNPGTTRPQAFDIFSAGPDGIADTVDDDWGG